MATGDAGGNSEPLRLRAGIFSPRGRADAGYLALFLAVFWVVTFGVCSAQIPAQPADPHQAIPAQAVQPAVAAPVAPAPPVSPPPANPGAPSLAIIADGSLKAVLQELAQTWADSLDSSPQVPITLTNAGTMRAKTEAGGPARPAKA
jgi:hypothetical protein